MGSNFLEDLSKLGSSAVRSGVDGVTHLGQDAQAVVDTATRSTQALAGSGVNSAGQVIGPAAEMFGSDPHTFILNVAGKMRATARTLCVRVAERTGKLSYTFPTAAGQRKVSAKPASNANANTIALTLALAAQDAPATMIEESGRMATGQPVKERGLSGFTFTPLSLSGASGDKERGLFGIDDAVLLSIVVPIIAAIAVKVLPALIAAAGNIINQVTNPGPTPEAQAAAAQAAQQADQQKTMVTVGVVVGVVVIGGIAIFAVMRKKKAA